jgi:hypothetical protein
MAEVEDGGAAGELPGPSCRRRRARSAWLCDDAAVSKLAVALTGLFAAVCLLSAALQYNDPDPVRWIALYLASGVAAVLALVRPGSWPLAAWVAAIGAAWAIALWVDVAGEVAATDIFRKMVEKGGKVEVMREAGGLTIAFAGSAIAALAARSRRGEPRSSLQPG